jgi:hypothetical protein
MNPFSDLQSAGLLPAFGLLCAGGAAITGCLVSLVLRIGFRGVWKDALLGFTGFLVTFLAYIFIQIHFALKQPGESVSLGKYFRLSTEIYAPEFLRPEWLAEGVAILLPILHELYRFLQIRRNRAKA